MQDVSFSHLTLNSAIALKPILQNKCQSRPEPPLGDSNRGLLPLSGNTRLAKARGQAPPGSHTAGPATCFEGTAYQKSPCSCRNVLGFPTSPAPLSPGCPASLCWQSQPNHSERAGAVQRPDSAEWLAPTSTHAKTYTVPLSGHSLGLFPWGRAWDKGCCSFPLPFHLCQVLSSSMCKGTHRCTAPEGVSTRRRW